MIESGEDKYIIPAGDGIGTPIILDIGAVVKAEFRMREVSRVNSQTAPELLATFNEHWLTLHNAVGKVTLERNVAAGALEDAKAEALLSCNDEAIRQRGHAKTSADLREAVATLDPTVKIARNRLNEIKAVLSYLEGKAKAFENAYNSVKKLVDNRGLPPASLNGPEIRPQLSAIQKKDEPTFTSPEDELVGFEEPFYARRY